MSINKYDNPFILTEKQKESMKTNLITGIYKQLYKNGFLNTHQLNRLLEMQTGSRKLK